MPNQSAQPIAFGKYTLLERISHGGMAEVFRARTLGEAGFERIVAIKLLLPQVAMDEEFVTMLIDEAKIAGQLSHANIAQIFDLGRADDRYYIVQEYVPGRDLRAILRHLSDRDERLSLAQCCHILLKVCEGLDYAHNKRDAAGNPLNLVHRDISPQNVIASYEGEIKLIDFGIVKAEGRATRTLAGLVKGKFAYMSPEQLRGLPVDRRSDVFACGIVLHELLTGEPLFKRGTEFETLRRARYADIEPPSKVNPEVPPELDRIALKGLARHVDDRYQSALQFRDELWEFVRSHGCFYTRNELAAWMRQTFPEGSPAGDLDLETDSPSAAREIPPNAGVQRLADLPAAPGATPPLDYDQSDPDSELPHDPDVYADMRTLVEPGFSARFAADDGPPPEGDGEPPRSTKPMGSTAPAVRDLANAAMSQPDRAVFIPGTEEGRLAVGSDPSIDLGVKLPRRSPTEEEETTAQRPNATDPTAPATEQPRPGAAPDGFGGQTDPIGNARWIEPTTPTRQRPRAIDPGEGIMDPESAATSPYLPAVRGGGAAAGGGSAAPSGEPAPLMKASTSGEAIKDALAHARTLGPSSPRLPGMPPVRPPGEQSAPEPPAGRWSPGAPAASGSGPGPATTTPGAPEPMSGQGMPNGGPGHGMGGPMQGPGVATPLPAPTGSPMGPSMMPGPGPSLSPLPGPSPMSSMQGAPMQGTTMQPPPMQPPTSPMPGPGMQPGPAFHPHPTGEHLPGPPFHPHPTGEHLPGPPFHPPTGEYPPGPTRSRSSLFLIVAAVLVLVGAAITSLVLAASGS